MPKGYSLGAHRQQGNCPVEKERIKEVMASYTIDQVTLLRDNSPVLMSTSLARIIDKGNFAHDLLLGLLTVGRNHCDLLSASDNTVEMPGPPTRWTRLTF